MTSIDKGRIMNIGLIAILSSCIGAPLIIMIFMYFITKRQEETKSLTLKKEILNLEIEKEKLHLITIEEENKKLDRIIEEKSN
jgi:hypothetical protein